MLSCLALYVETEKLVFGMYFLLALFLEALYILMWLIGTVCDLLLSIWDRWEVYRSKKGE